jgi:hypothetical protein
VSEGQQVVWAAANGQSTSSEPVCRTEAVLCGVAQARQVGVADEKLRGPVYADYLKLDELPSGATIVQSEKDSRVVDGLVNNRLVCVVTAAQERAGYYYDRSEPFVVNGKLFWPPVRGIWKEAAGMGYAVRAYADANGVTARLRKQMKVTNERKGSEVIARDVIAQRTTL